MRSVDDSDNKSPLSVIAKMNAGDRCPPATVSDLQVFDGYTFRTILKYPIFM